MKLPKFSQIGLSQGGGSGGEVGLSKLKHIVYYPVPLQKTAQICKTGSFSAICFGVIALLFWGEHLSGLRGVACILAVYFPYAEKEQIPKSCF